MQPEERKYLLQVSDIEKKILEKNQFFEKRKKVCMKESDFKWWSFDDRQTSFVLTTKRMNTYKKGEQIFNCYGRRSNKFILLYYGFCISPNQYDSLQVRIWRKVDKKDKTDTRLADALLVSEEAFLKQYDEIDNQSKKIRFRASRLNDGKKYLGIIDLDLLSYLRAHCLVMYDGPHFQRIKMTEATVIDFEICVLEQYLKLLKLVKEHFQAKGL